MKISAPRQAPATLSYAELPNVGAALDLYGSQYNLKVDTFYNDDGLTSGAGFRNGQAPKRGSLRTAAILGRPRRNLTLACELMGEAALRTGLVNAALTSSGAQWASRRLRSD